MAARKSKHRNGKPTKRGSRGSKPQHTRLSLSPPLSAREVRELRARAVADMRTVSNYLSHLVVGSLKRKRIGPEADPTEERRYYHVQLFLTANERKRLEARAAVERRSVTGYVARVIVGELMRK